MFVNSSVCVSVSVSVFMNKCTLQKTSSPNWVKKKVVRSEDFGKWMSDVGSLEREDSLCFSTTPIKTGLADDHFDLCFCFHSFVLYF